MNFDIAIVAAVLAARESSEPSSCADPPPEVETAASVGRLLDSLTSALSSPSRYRSLGMPHPHLSPCERSPLVRTYWEVVMRMMLKAVLDTEAVNEFFRGGGTTEGVDQIVENLQPEAFYAFGEDGHRALVVVFDLADPSQLPAKTEPLFQQAKAKVTVTPCMNLDDLKKGVEEMTAQMQAMQGQPTQ